ncbi:MAG: GTP-binding protein [Candidatus Helarchaeota archaeon]
MVKVKNSEEIQKMIKEHPLELRRIFSIVAHIDHGKSTACDYLMSRAGLMSAEYDGEKRLTDYDEEEQQRGITIFTSVITLNYEYKGKTYMLEINDTPGHISFTGEVSRALRGSDGAVLLVDALEGLMTQTITNIGLAVGNEWCKPVLFINKVDRLIQELKLPPDKILQRFERIINDVNDQIENVVPEHFKGKWTVDAAKGQVVFGSAKDGWGFTIPSLQKKGITAQVVLDKYRESIDKNDKEPIRWLKENLPLDEAMLEVIIEHLPSPDVAQKYRMLKLWAGDIKKGLSVMDEKDPSAFKSDLEQWTAWSLINIRKDGPVLGTITKLFVHPKTKRVILIGRVWSGTIRAGDTLFLLNARKTFRIRRLGIMEIDSLLQCNEIPAGNLFALELPDIQPAGETFCSEKYKDEMKGFEAIAYVSDPVVSVSIKPENPQDLAKLGDVVKKWVLADPTASFRRDDVSKEYILSGIDPLQIEIITERIQDEISIKIGVPITVYHEVPLMRSPEINTKCTEGHNKLKGYVEPLDPESLKLVQEKKIFEMQEPKVRAEILRKEAGWDKKEARRIWAIEGNNILVNGSVGVQRLDRIKSYLISAFRDFCMNCSLAKEPAMGIKFVVTDATIHEDPTHTRSGQIFVMANSAYNIAFLSSNPALFEPILRLDIKTPIDTMGSLMTIITQHRGKVINSVQVGGSAEIQGEIPASEAVNLKGGQTIADEFRAATQGKAIFGYQFSRFEMLPKSLQYEMIEAIRKRKKEEGKEINVEMPTPATFKNRMYPEWQSRLPEIKNYLKDNYNKLVVKEILDKMDAGK